MAAEPLRMAYADPPYQGCAGYYRDHPDFAGEVDHDALIRHLIAEFPDGWALSCSSPSLRALLPLCPESTRVMAWVKPFCSWKPNVNPAYAWEPVLVYGGRTTTYRDGGTTVRDYVTAPMTMKRGLVGVKPEPFCFWLFDVLGVTPEDELVDLFPGSGAVSRAWDRWCQQLRPTAHDDTQLELESVS